VVADTYVFGFGMWTNRGLWMTAVSSVAMTGDVVKIRPTVGATVHAPDLAQANRAMAAQAGETKNGSWPSDMRFGAPPRAEITTADSLPRMLPDGIDALTVPTSAIVGDLSGLCAVAIADVTVLARPFDDAVALDIAALTAGVEAPLDVWPLAAAEHTELVVFGAHLRGGPLAHQLTGLGARWSGELTTAPRYRMTVLPTSPAKPAITRVADDAAGAALSGHRWLLSPAGLGRFLAALPAPMQLGKVEFDDGTWRTAFGCDGAAATGPDISSFGSWPAAIAAGAV
jgi:allophanate hydrolase